VEKRLLINVVSSGDTGHCSPEPFNTLPWEPGAQSPFGLEKETTVQISLPEKC